jgi:hypothetical protein
MINSTTNFFDMINSIKSSKSYLVFYDDQVLQKYGYLRSLPLLTHILKRENASVVGKQPDKDCIFPIPIGDVPYTYIPIGCDVTLQIPGKTGVLCVYVDEELDEDLHYVSECIEQKYPMILVVAKPAYIPKGWKKSGLTLEDRSEYSMDYLGLLKDYAKSRGLSTNIKISMNNLALIELYHIHTHLTNKTLLKTEDLFDFEDPRLTISPIWDIAIKIAFIKEENQDSDNFVLSCISPYFEKDSDLERVGDKILKLLSHYSFDWEKIKHYRDVTKVSQFSIKKNRDLIETMENSYLRKILQNQLEVENDN